MFDYLQQFNNLPKNLRDQVSSPSAMALISELETKYKVDLAIVIMKLMVKSLKFSDLPAYLTGELLLTPETAAQLVKELKEKIFAPMADYLGLTSEIRALDLDKDIEVVIKEAGLVLPSAVAISRFKNIVSTYARGIRSKIDTRNTLSKDVKIGGLNLSPEEIDRVLKICDTRISKGLITPAVTTQAAPVSMPPVTRLDKIIGGADKAAPVSSEYNLKQALAKGETKSVVPAPLDTKHELAKPEAQLDLPKPEVKAEIKSVVLNKPVAEIKPIAPAPVVPTAPKVSPVVPIVPITPKISPVSPKIAPVKHESAFTKFFGGHKEVAPVVAVAPVTPKFAPAIPAAKIISTPPVSMAAARTLAGKQALASSAAHPQMHDIKPMPKVMGPIEELQFLDVINFRRLGTTPAEITSKVFAKIKLLEKDGYDKMVAGVRAWRQSPVSRLYLRLGQEAIAKGQPLKQIAEARKAANQEYLSMDEIEAIVSLNSKLVF
ncbi:MAG: hypothetical protein WC719_03805 [Patescibacteria group bacterium]|jgi:hypothetical protein